MWGNYRSTKTKLLRPYKDLRGRAWWGLVGGDRPRQLLRKRATCPWHGATFDVRTGEVVGPPAQQAVVRYSVRVTGNDIEVEL